MGMCSGISWEPQKQVPREERRKSEQLFSEPTLGTGAVPDMPSLTLFTQTTSRVVIIRPILQIRKPTWVKNTLWEDLRGVQRSAGVQTGGLVRQGEVRRGLFLSDNANCLLAGIDCDLPG